MGSGQSTRTLTIPNEEEIGVIQVSNALVQRLAQGAINEATGENIKDVRPPVGVQQPYKATATAPPTESGGVSTGYPVYYYPELTMSALDIQRQKEEELQTQSIYWQKRLKNMEKNHQTIDRLLKEEYRKAVAEFSPSKSGQKIDCNCTQLCLDTKDKVLKCYQENPRETLKCSTLVEEFSNCVDQRRASLIAARC